ncbi:MAG: hypothetical protein IJS02_04325 [Bacteroidales bacterium]|nr:hypothetical protein [Bacteroidales bacterium]
MKHGTLCKRFTVIAFALISVLAATSCTEYWGLEKKHGEASRAILIYFAGNNNLSYYMKQNLNDIYGTNFVPRYTSDTVLLVFEHMIDRTPLLRRYYRTDQGDLIGEVITVYDKSFSSGKVESFTQVEKEAFSKFPAKSKGLMVSSHGSGWLPEGYYSDPQDFSEDRLIQFQMERTLDEGIVKSSDPETDNKSICYDGYLEFDVAKWAKAMNEHYEFICLDACFMSSIEVVYELRHNADYILASPTEILAYGYPYKEVFDNLILGGESNLKNFCNEMLAYHLQQERSCTITLTKCSGLEMLASFTRQLYAQRKTERAAVNPNAVQPFFRSSDDWFYDLGDYIEHFATPEEYQAYDLLLRKVVINKANTSKFLSLPIIKNSGLSTYIPKARYPKLNAYYKTLEWNKDTNSIGE